MINKIKKLLLATAEITILGWILIQGQAWADSSTNAFENSPKTNSKSFGDLDITIPNWLSKSATFSEHEGKGAQITRINLALRWDGFSPILSKSDVEDWRANWLKPYAKSEREHRWLQVIIDPNSTNIDLEKQYQEDMFAKKGNSKRFSCDQSQFQGLTHCATAPGVELLELTEIFFNLDSKSTLVECLESQSAANYKRCTHYFYIPRLHGIAEVIYGSDEEVSNWEAVEAGVKKAVANISITKIK